MTDVDDYFPTIIEQELSVSTGKEANVYHGFGQDFELAIKIFKTSILIFKDRERYVSGDYRYRKGFCKSNPRKMVKMWAEKEMRNLKRLEEGGILSPKVVVVKNNVLVMEFLGVDGWPAPRLKDADFDENQKNEAYLQTVKIMHRLYNTCNMVHADLSEYNLIWWKNSVYVIDVGQSVELSHPQATDFLRIDCLNISTYFNRLGIHTLSPKELFYLVTNPSVKEDVIESLIHEHFEENWMDDVDVFMNSFIPSNLHELNKPLREVFAPKKSTGVMYFPVSTPKHVKLEPLQIIFDEHEKENLQSKETSKTKDNSNLSQIQQISNEEDESSSEESSSEDLDKESKKERKRKYKEANTIEPEVLKQMKKEHKAEVKEQKRLKRKEKIPKKKKQQLIKKSKRNQTTK
ncbi:Serine/threonine-protein kinase RIO1 [Entamoeba marina]